MKHTTTMKEAFEAAKRKEEQRKRALERARTNRVDNAKLVTKQIDKLAK
jgi:hypothetical protein